MPLSPGGLIRANEFCRGEDGERVYVVGDAGGCPGPDWMPKQVHMADLQAKAASQNLLLALDEQGPVARPKTELVCIIDTIDAGILIDRDIKRSWQLPSSRLFHRAKRMFERHYLRVFRA